jgi:hypothetical protein
LYENQANQVTDFLTQMMFKELKDEALKRSLDVSFEFPEAAPSLPALGKKVVEEVDEFKPAFDRRSLDEELS